MEIESYLPGMLPMISADAKTFLEGLVGDTTPDLPTFMKAIAKRYGIAQEWGLFMDRYLLVLGPISTLQPFEVGYDLQGPEQLKRIGSIRLWSVNRPKPFSRLPIWKSKAICPGCCR